MGKPSTSRHYDMKNEEALLGLRIISNLQSRKVLSRRSPPGIRSHSYARVLKELSFTLFTVLIAATPSSDRSHLASNYQDEEVFMWLSYFRIGLITEVWNSEIDTR